LSDRAGGTEVDAPQSKERETIMKARSLMGSIVVIGAALAGAGCSSSTPVAQAPARTGMSTPPFESNVVVKPPTSSTVVVDERIARACNLPTPHFAFDSARVEESADAGLEKIAQCFTSGPLAGRKLNLVGHADPRGETEYNYALGQRRAGGVATYLEDHGVRTTQVTTTSRGELDATGTNEATWARDRRVDMNLAD
jgi:peptidoglycan-associated lipoprotein